MIWLPFGLLLTGAIGGWLMARNTREDGWYGMTAVCGAIAFILLIILPVTAMKNSADFAELEAFYQANSLNYEVAIDETASYLSEESFRQALIEGSIEKFELTGYVSERIAEWRDAVNQYNLTIARMKYWDGNILVGVLYPDGLKDTKLLIIK